MTSLLHISDTHLGKRQYRSEERRDDFAVAFDQAIDIALGEHPNHDNDPVDAVIHTGDLFDDSEARLPDMHRCQQTLRRLQEADIPFYAIIGNHERKLTTQFVDLYEDAGLCTRLGKEPTIVGDVALYGIDAVRRRAWESTDFTLEAPQTESSLFEIVCMHQLVTPPIEDDYLAEYEAGPIIERFGRDIDAMALGDYHKRCSATVEGVKLWYPGSTERCAMDETEKRSVDLLNIDMERDDPLTRRRLTLTTPKFQRVSVDFSEGDTLTHVQAQLEAYVPFGDDVVIVELEGENVSVTKQQVYGLLDQYDVRVAKVHDRRSLDDFDVESGSSAPTTVNDIDSAVEEAFEERDFDETTEHISDIVQDTDEIAKSNVEREVATFLEQAEDDEDDTTTEE